VDDGEDASGHVDDGEDASGHVDEGEDASATHESKVAGRAGWVDIADAAPMPQPNHLAIRPREQLGPPIVGGLLIGVTDDLPALRRKRKRGYRGKAFSSRKPRTCLRCVKCKGLNADKCNGRIGGKKGGQKACEFSVFSEADADTAAQAVVVDISAKT
jgi:hypothetical protein